MLQASCFLFLPLLSHTSCGVTRSLSCLFLYLYFRANTARASFLAKDYEEDACDDELTQLLLGNVMPVEEETSPQPKVEDTPSQPQQLLNRKERKLKTKKRSNHFKVKRTKRHSVRRLFMFSLLIIDSCEGEPRKAKKPLASTPLQPQG